jgi:transposase-like protein
MSFTTASNAVQNGSVDDEQRQPEVPAKPKRRSFTAEYKARIVDDYYSMTDHGDRGALLRREGLYSSHVAEWRKARDRGVLDALEPKLRTPKKSAEQRELEALRKRNERLERKVAAQQTALELAGKAHALLEMLSESAESNNDSSKK